MVDNVCTTRTTVDEKKFWRVSLYNHETAPVHAGNQRFFLVATAQRDRYIHPAGYGTDRRADRSLLRI